MRALNSDTHPRTRLNSSPDIVAAVAYRRPGERRASPSECESARVVLATGFNAVRPDPLLPRTGRGLHYCLHCDDHMFDDEP
jgi:thioredoxin reductase